MLLMENLHFHWGKDSKARKPNETIDQFLSRFNLFDNSDFGQFQFF